MNSPNSIQYISRQNIVQANFKTVFKYNTATSSGVVTTFTFDCSYNIAY